MAKAFAILPCAWVPRLVKFSPLLHGNSYTSTARSRCLVSPENRVLRLPKCFKINASSQRIFPLVAPDSLFIE